MSSCFCRVRRQGMEVPPPSLSALGAVVLVSRLALTSQSPPSAPPRAFWASLWRLVLSLSLLAFPGPAVSARVSSSLSTTHHVHHFHNKHGTVPIAINRMPFLTRGGHGRYSPSFISALFCRLDSCSETRCGMIDSIDVI